MDEIFLLLWLEEMIGAETADEKENELPDNYDSKINKDLRAIVKNLPDIQQKIAWAVALAPAKRMEGQKKAVSISSSWEKSTAKAAYGLGWWLMKRMSSNAPKSTEAS